MEILIFVLAYLVVACVFAFGFGWSTGAAKEQIELVDVVMAVLWPAGLIGFLVWSSMNAGRRAGVRRRNLEDMER